MICSLCDKECEPFYIIDGVCIRCIEDGANLPDELTCSDIGFDLPELDPTPEELFPDSPQDRRTN